jgi:hypothetical protein
MIAAKNNLRDKAKRSLPPPGHFVKARLVTSGISQKRLATESGLTETLLSNMLAGRRRGRHSQIAVWEAFCRMTCASGTVPTLTDFWGALLNRRLGGPGLPRRSEAKPGKKNSA